MLVPPSVLHCSLDGGVAAAEYMNWTTTKPTSEPVPSTLNSGDSLTVRAPLMQSTVSVPAPDGTAHRGGVLAPVLLNPAFGNPSDTGEAFPQPVMALFSTDVQTDPATIFASAVLASLTYPR